MTDLVGRISELEMIHKVSEGVINAIVRPTAIFTQLDKLKTMEIIDAETNLTKNHQDNDTMPPTPDIHISRPRQD